MGLCCESTQNQKQNIQNDKKIGNGLLNQSKNPNYQISEINSSNKKENQSNKNMQGRINKDCLDTHAKPALQDEVLELYSYESAVCKIKINEKSGTGFFCEINDKNIPFNISFFKNIVLSILK